MSMHNLALGAGKRRQSRRLDLRQNLFRIPSTISIDLGLQWSFVGADPVDLDASCVAMGANGECLDVIFFGNLICESARGAYMRHSGDNLTGEDEGDNDDESLHFVFSNVPDDVHYLMVAVTSYTGADFTLVDRASCHLRNAVTNETVGEFQLGLVGAHTATLLCCISRVEPTPQDPNTYWDLRELGLPTSGFTFVEVIPFMQELIGVPDQDREVLQRMLPDYSLVKDASQRARYVAPSMMKFAIGWDGDNDLDSFLVMLNDKDEYIDHVYAKHGKIKSSEGAAIHSGDKLNGFAGDGDDEYIDVDVNRLRKDVHRVFFIVTLHSGFAKTLGDVPNSYCRMQNKRPTEPFMEVDRMNISRRGGPEKTLLLSMLLRKDPVRFEYLRLHETVSIGAGDYIEVLPWLRLISSFFTERLAQLGPLQSIASAGRSSAHLPVHSIASIGRASSMRNRPSNLNMNGSDPQLELMPNDDVSIGRRSSVAIDPAALPSGSAGGIVGAPGSMSARRVVSPVNEHATSGSSQILHPRTGSDVGGGAGHGTTAAAPEGDEYQLQSYWDAEWEKTRDELTVPRYGLEIVPIRVTGLGPLEPHHFACHVEMWVCDRKCRDRGRSDICNNRDVVEWNPEDPSNRCRFAVRRYDRVRLLVYEHSVAGYVDLEVYNIGDGFFQNEDVELTMALRGKEATGELTFRCRHIPLEYVKGFEVIPWYKKYICSVM